MCLIIASRTGNKPDADTLWNAYTGNSDGWGIVTVDGGKLKAWRGFGYADLGSRLDSITGPYCLHFRYATHGAVNIGNCHPFKVNKSLYMMHNGIIRIPLADKARSDSWNFARHYVRPYVQTHGMDNLITDAEQFIGQGNKLTFMTGDGEILIANESAGVWRGGMWFSNSYSFDEPAWVTASAWDWRTWREASSEPQLDSIALDVDSPCDMCELDTDRLYYEPDTAMYICAECAAMVDSEVKELGLCQ